MVSESRVSVVIAAAALSSAILSGQTPPAPPVPAARVVAIDVVAADAKGRAVETLKAADFEVKDGGAAQTLESVRLVTNEPRVFAIYLDEYHVAADNTDRARAAVARFIDSALKPGDELVVMKPLDSLLAIKLSTDRDAARSIVAGFSGRKGDYEARTSYERNFMAGTPARIESARTQVAWSALNALATHLGSLNDRRKTLIVVSNGLIRGEHVRGEAMPTFDTVVRAANRSNVSMYAVDPREGPDADSGASSLLPSLAAETDGRSIEGDLDAGLARAADDAASYYLLTYRAAPAEDGKFHSVDVRVVRKGVDVRARKGYYAPSPDDALRAALLAHLNEPKVTRPPEPAPHVSTLIRPWFGMALGPSGHTRVTFLWEPAVRVPGDRGRRDVSRLVLTALAADGAVLFENTVLPTGPGVVDLKDVPGATPVRAVFDAAPGRLRLRMSIQDAAGDVLDRDVRDIAVADLRGRVAIGTPEVLRARNDREFRALDDQASVPVVAREFSRMERLLIRVPVYSGNAASNASLSAKLLSGRGSAMRDLAVVAPQRPGLPNEIDLPLAGLAAGEYLIDLTVTSAGGEARDRLSIRVTP